MIRSFFSYKSTGVKVWIDDRLVYNNLLMSIAIGVCKYNGGGMQQLPEAVADDGLLDVSLIRPVHFWHILFRFRYLFNGGDLPGFGISCRRGAAVSAIESSPEISVEVDGELLGGVSVGVFRIAPSCSDRGFGGVPQAGELSVVFVQYRLI